ncbi:transmembrane protein [Perilla frutescens var. frutescens]|nr:transmembrane protein [Perilla frutescens var. frutescens]
MSEAPMVGPRKLGKQIILERRSSAEAPVAGKGGEGLSAEVSASGEEAAPVGQEEEMKTNHHRRGVDKSVAGGGVIIGGLATTFLVAIFCYIRATRRRAAEPGSPTNTNSSVGRKNGELGSPVINL